MVTKNYSISLSSARSLSFVLVLRPFRFIMIGTTITFILILVEGLIFLIRVSFLLVFHL